jgi:hypothetical protein
MLNFGDVKLITGVLVGRNCNDVFELHAPRVRDG